jgi:hypothetical protein
MVAPRISIVFFVSLALVLAAGCRSPKGTTPQEKRNYTENMRKEALAELYKEHPEARSQLNNAPGYAVFSNVGSKIFMLATGSGFGVAVNNRTGKKTYMKMRRRLSTALPRAAGRSEAMRMPEPSMATRASPPGSRSIPIRLSRR